MANPIAKKSDTGTGTTANPVTDKLAVAKTVIAWAERAEKRGLDLSTDLQPSIDDPAMMQRLVHYMKDGRPQHGIVYDAVTVSRILGLPVACNALTPKPEDGEIVIYYGGWSLKALRESKVGKQYMHQHQDWYEPYEWQTKPGYYRLLLPVHNSNHFNWEEQLRYLTTVGTSWETAPVCVVALALLVHLEQTGNNLLKKNFHFCRCREVVRETQLKTKILASLMFRDDGMQVREKADYYSHEILWLAASQRC